MNSKTLFFDFETVDPYIKTLGPGWATDTVQILGMGYFIEGITTEPMYESDTSRIKEIVSSCDTWVAHNIQYDAGVLSFIGVDIANHLLVDTIHLAKLNHSGHPSYSLDSLSERYLGTKKTTDKLIEWAVENKLIRSATALNAKDNVMSNLNKFPPELVAEYCKQDVLLLKNLYEKVSKDVDQEWVLRLSNLNKILIKSRAAGIKLDLDKLNEVRNILYKKEVEFYNEAMTYAPADTNLNSTKQLAEVATKLKLRVPTTAKGNPSVDSKWLDEQTHPFCKALKEHKKYQKARRDFCDTVLENQENLPDHKKGRVYPSFSPLGAITGRFTCQAPNIQQIPARDDEIGPLIRSFYVPNDGEKWLSLDFSAQEPRLQIHFAEKIGATGGSLLGAKFRQDPYMDLHQEVADLCKITRKEAKTINLGLSYGMGKAKLADSLGISVNEAVDLQKRYNKKAPFLKQLSDMSSQVIQTKGHVKSLLGRKLSIEDPVMYNGKLITFERKAFNKLIQGSAADQIIESIVKLDQAGFPIMFSVHDEINLSIKDESSVETIKKIMETATTLTVPVVAEAGIGDNWARAKK